MAKKLRTADRLMEARARLTQADYAKTYQAWEFGFAQSVEGMRKAAARRVAREERAPYPAHPPAGNTGGNYESIQLVARDGQVVEVPMRRGWGGDSAFIDWLNFTVLEDSFFWGGSGSAPVTDGQVMVECSIVLERIFGFGIAHKRDKGANFYQTAWDLEEGAGLVCYGGQRNTVLVSISGKGLALASDGWEKRLYGWLTEKAVQPRITRVDLAHDDYEGKNYSVDRADADYDAGLFRSVGAGRMPDVEQRGNWKNPNGKGRTLYVGNRENGKFLRVYEKGRQLGAPDSEWCRVELELKAQDRHIPFDVLLKAGEYLAGSYMALAWISETQQRIKTTTKTAQFTYAAMKDWLRHQCGAALNVIKECETDFESAVLALVRDAMPGRLKSLPLRGESVSLHRMQTSSDLTFCLS